MACNCKIMKICFIVQLSIGILDQSDFIKPGFNASLHVSFYFFLEITQTIYIHMFGFYSTKDVKAPTGSLYSPVQE